MKIVVALMLVLLTAGCAPKSSVVDVAAPAGAGASGPFLFATRDGVLLSWLEPVAGSDRVALRFARYRDGQWSAPQTVVERNDLVVNWADFPSIVEDASGTLFAHWIQKNGDSAYAADVWVAASKDGGVHWDEAILLNRGGTPGEHGFATLMPLANGGVATTWLDGRNDMTVRYATVERNGRFASDEELDSRTCECCTTDMAMTPSGPLIVYRDRSAEEIRDIAYVRRGAGGWSEPRLVREDGWKITGCPVNGPRADAIGNSAVVAWFTAANEQPRVQAAFSNDGGTTFGEAIVVDDGKPAGRVDVVMLDEHTAVVSWVERTVTGAEVRARRITAGGKPGASVTIAASANERAPGVPRIARVGREVWFAWTEQGATKRIRVARGKV